MNCEQLNGLENFNFQRVSRLSEKLAFRLGNFSASIRLEFCITDAVQQIRTNDSSFRKIRRSLI
jgi:hypothetical protein